MATCTRCGAGDWHPDVRNCVRTDCELLLARVDLRQQPANDRQADRLGREVQGIGIHTQEVAA